MFIKIVKKTSLAANYFQEAQALYATTHANILKIRCATEDTNNVYLVMDICPNGSVQSLYNASFLTCRNILKIAHDFLSGLHFVHAKGLIHFDVKPSNILLTGSWTAVLADFGLAQWVNNQGFATPQSLYNNHIPPEIYISTSLTSLSDIYQAGVTIYRMCNGDAIFRSQIQRHRNIHQAVQNGNFPDRNGYLPHVPKKLRRVINKAMKPAPNGRYQAVLDFQNALAQVDDNIDWQCATLGNTWHWERQTPTHCICFETTPSSSSALTFNASSYKINTSNRQRRSISAWCRNDIPNAQWGAYCTNALEVLS